MHFHFDIERFQYEIIRKVQLNGENVKISGIFFMFSANIYSLSSFSTVLLRKLIKKISEMTEKF